jgi:protein-disulfide isomerase
MRNAAFLSNLQKWLWVFPALAIVTIIIGQLCQSQCAVLSGDILGIDLNIFGVLFYGLLLAAVIVYQRLYHKDVVMKAVAALASIGLGAEFILIKFQIQNNTYCPKCLISGFFFLVMFFIVVRNLKVWVVALLVAAGALFTSFTFNGSIIPSYAEEVGFPTFGNAKAQTEVIVYSDYFCPACMSVDEQINKRLIKLRNKVKIHFVDVPLHPPLSAEYAEVFLFAWFEAGNNLEKAIKVRDILFSAAKTKAPQRDVLNALKAQGIPLKEDKESARKIFRERYNSLMKTDKVKATPTVAIAQGGNRASYVGGADIIKALDRL